MSSTRKRGRPREWVLDEEISIILKLRTELTLQNPQAKTSDIMESIKDGLVKSNNQDLLSKLDKILNLIKQNVLLPPPCICGKRLYSYTFRKGNTRSTPHWAIFARCVNPNCRHLKRYMPWTTYKWSRLKSALKELESEPTYYQMDGQLVEGSE